MFITFLNIICLNKGAIILRKATFYKDSRHFHPILCEWKNITDPKVCTCSSGIIIEEHPESYVTYIYN